MENKLINLENNIEKNKQKIENLKKRLKKIEDSISKIKIIENKLLKLEEIIENMQYDKGKKWDKLIDYLFYAVVAYCLYKLGIN